MINESSDLKVLSKWALKEYLLTGNVGVVPTDTVPALAVVPYYSHLIWKLKRRPADKPLILMGAGMDNLLVHTDPRCHKDAKNFGTKYWPGPLTLVLPAKGDLVNSLNPVGSTLGLRIPSCSLTLSLLEKTGPLATSSANPSGLPTALSALHAASYFPNIAQLGPKPWQEASGETSSVVAWTGSGRWRILRRGSLIPDGLN